MFRTKKKPEKSGRLSTTYAVGFKQIYIRIWVFLALKMGAKVCSFGALLEVHKELKSHLAAAGFSMVWPQCIHDIHSRAGWRSPIPASSTTGPRQWLLRSPPLTT
jgi:hypothetical protein